MERVEQVIIAKGAIIEKKDIHTSTVLMRENLNIGEKKTEESKKQA